MTSRFVKMPLIGGLSLGFLCAGLRSSLIKLSQPCLNSRPRGASSRPAPYPVECQVDIQR
jgi:hypothetical protein